MRKASTPRKVWMQSPPGTGGVKIPPDVQARTQERIERFAAEHYAGKYLRLDIRFRGQFCYIGAYTEPQPFLPIPGFPETEEEFPPLIKVKTNACFVIV